MRVLSAAKQFSVLPLPSQAMRNKTKAIRLLAAALTVLVIPLEVFAALPTSGKCGVLLQVPNNYGEFKSGDTNFSNGLAVFDFSAKTVSYNFNLVTNNAGVFVFSQDNGTSSFTSSASGFFDVVTFNISLGQFKLNLLAVNSNNTFLMQGGANSDMERITGVCQLK